MGCTLCNKPYVYGMILALGRVTAKKIPGLRPVLRRGAMLIWRLIGSLKFRAAYRNACRRGDVRLHVGAGSTRLDGWLNTDILPTSPLFLDATHRFPIRGNSVLFIFNEHFIEHVPRHRALAFLKESFRVLQPGGVLRISTEDVEALVRAYINHPRHVRLLNERNRRRGYQYTYYPVDILNKAFLEDDHVCLYDTQTLEQMLSSVGFRDITRCKVGESHHAALCGIEQHDVGSIADKFTCIIEATKPSL